MEMELYKALIRANVPEDDAREVVNSIKKEIDSRYSLHKDQLFTKQDGAELEGRLLRALADMQRWTLATVFGALGALAILIKLWS